MAKNSGLKLLSTGEIGTIYEKCLQILSTKGVKIGYLKGLQILQKAGAAVDFDRQQVSFPTDMIEAALRTVPQSVTLSGTGGRPDIILPHRGGSFYTRSSTGATSYLDPDSGMYRDLSMADVRHCVQLVEALDQLDICGYAAPKDVPEATAEVHALRAAFENTTKHIFVQPYSVGSLEYLFQLAVTMAGSEEALRKKPPMHITTGSLAPLGFSDRTVESVIQACRYGIPITAGFLSSSGGTAPFTIAGTVLLSGVMVLAKIIMAQTIRPGIPIIAVPIPFTVDMTTGAILGSSVEAVLTAAASVQFVKEVFHIPTHTYGFNTDAYVPDGQSMVESTLAGMLTSLAGCDILGGAGQINVSKTISPVQLVVHNHLAAMLKRISAGIAVNDDTLAWEEILAIAPDGQFLDRPHTLRHCREALRPKLFRLPSMEEWTAAGSKDLYARALEEYREIKKELQPQPLPAEVLRELDRIVKHADQQLVK